MVRSLRLIAVATLMVSKAMMNFKNTRMEEPILTSNPPTLNLTAVGQRSPSTSAPISNILIARKYKFLTKNLIGRTVKDRYRSSMLGYLWSVLEPLLLAAVYYFLFNMLAGNPDRLYGVWVLIGVIIWTSFGKTLSATITSLSSNKGIINLIYFPRVIFPISLMFSNIVLSLMSCIVIFPILFVYGVVPSLYLLYIPAAVFLSGFLGIGLGMVFAPLNCIQKDVEHLFRFIVRAGFFFSPVMWTYEMALERGTFSSTLLSLNPMVTPITIARHGFAGHSTTLPTFSIVYSISFAIIMWILGSIIFNRYERQAVKYL
jgi:lipopolysaccharide transport system permease protein